MIDPVHITDFDRSEAQLEELLLNAVSFAGKNARQQAVKMHALLHSEKGTPFENVRRWRADGTLMNRLVESKIGKYRLLHDAFAALAHADLDLRSCTVERLAEFPGIGEKTARLFALHSRRGERYVVIDTHILKEMRALGMTNLRASPSGKRYLELEAVYRKHLLSQGVDDFAAFDLGVWRTHALKGMKDILA